MTTSLEKGTFLNWLHSEASKQARIISGTTIMGWISALGWFLYRNWLSGPGLSLKDALATERGRFFLGGLAAFHSLVCFLLIWAMPREARIIATNSRDNISITEAGATRILRMVMYLYTSLGLLYAIYSFFTLKNLPGSKQHWGQLSEILTATLLFFLYIELSHLTVTRQLQNASETGPVPDVAASTDAHRHRIVFAGIAMLLALLTILSHRYPSTSIPIEFVLRLIAASLSGVTLALVIGRLGSVYINPGAMVLSSLYLYAVIQPFAAFFHDVRFDFIVTSLALPLKILLWLVFTWAFTTGKIWEYVREIREFLEMQRGDQPTPSVPTAPSQKAMTRA